MPRLGHSFPHPGGFGRVAKPVTGSLGGVSPYSYSPDEFDVDEEDGTTPVGVHRAQLPAWRNWLPLLLVIVIAPLLAWGAVTLLGDAAGSRPEAKPSAATEQPDQDAATEPASTTPTGSVGKVSPGQEGSEKATKAAEGVNLTLGVTVHNGTTVSGLAGRTGDRLRNAGYTAVTVSQGIYSATDPQATTVFYDSDENMATARALADALGIDNVVQSTEATGSNPLVVVLRSDFQE